MAALRGLPGALGRVWGSSRAAFRRLSLRARLLLGLVVLAAVGLFAVDVVVYGELQSYLNNQVNGELQAAAVVSGRQALNLCTGFADAGRPAHLPLDTAVEFVSPTGRPLCAVPSSFHVLSIPADAQLQTGQLFDALAVAGGATGKYRVEPEPFSAGGAVGTALVAIPLASLDGTLHRLLLAEVAVSVAVLLALGGLGAGVVRVGLRPLAQMEETAAAIAAGDLSRRVEDDDAHTEVGRLGRSLNVMLATIERSFAEQQASEARLRRFLADASHELRTPVTSIRGYAELFRRGAADRPEDLRRAMRRIEDEAVRMGGLVEDLLLLARLDQGRPLEREPVDLSAIATDAAADAQVLDPDRPISAAVERGVAVLGDEQRLRQVVTNLVANALRHTPPGAAVTVSVDVLGGKARLSVHDEGPGIAEEHAGRIFERFYRADPSRTRGSGGAGLGLSIVASIAHSHGGRAYVETAPGKGATFVVELPLLEVGGVVEAPQGPPWPGEDEDRDRGVVEADEGEG